MRNEGQWTPTKFVLRSGHLRGAKTNALSCGSRLMADLIARSYERAIPLFARGDLLDLGCGEAPLYATYRGFVDSVTCVDWVTNDYLDLACDLTEPLRFSSGSFDTIILSDVLEHIPTPESLWHEMARVLRPEGTLILNVPFLYWIHAHPYDFHRYTRFALDRLAALSGLEVRRLEPLGGVIEVSADMAAKVAATVPVVGRPLASSLQATAFAFNGSTLGKRAVARTADHFPLGYFMVAQRPGPRP